MFRTPKVGTRALAGVATIATITGLTLPLMATAASAATTGVTVDTAAKAQSYRAATYQGLAVQPTATITGTLANDTNGPSPVRFIITAGPNADLGNNGANAADNLPAGATCTEPTTTTFSCSYADGAGKTGTDTVRVFADLNNDQIYQTTEPSDTATVTWTGAPFTIALQPSTATGATSSCKAFTAVVKDSNGNGVSAGTKVDVNLAQTSPAASSTSPSTVTFCDVTANGGPGGTNPQGTTASGTAAADGSRTAEFTTDSSGTVTFGVTNTSPSTISITAFVEDTLNNSKVDPGEPNATSTATFSAGGADSVKTLTASPKTVSQPVSTAVTFKATLKNSAGDTVSGVTPLAKVTSGPDAAVAVTCTASNQAGVSTCSYNAGATKGTDSVIAFVQQTAGGTPGVDASEPQDTVTVNLIAGAAGTAIDLVCTGTQAGGTAAVTTPAPGSDAAAEENCVSPTSRATETFTAYVTVPDGPDADTLPDPAANVPVTFSLQGQSANALDATLSATTVNTDAKGVATVTVTNPNPGTADTYQVKATTATDTASVSDVATETYAARATAAVNVTPANQTAQVNTAVTETATVTDQFGDPVASQAITFNVTGRNTRTSVGITTDAKGQATFSYTDTGSSTTTGTDTVNATSAGVSDTTPAKVFWITEAATVGQVILDVDNTVPCQTTAPQKTLSAALATTNTVCATVRTTSGNNTLSGQTVTFTITGVGTFADGKTTFTGTSDANGQVTAQVTSTKSGDQVIKAAVGTVSDTGTITYATPTAAQARNIDLKPDTSDLTNGSNELTALVTDEYGNPVPGVQVDFTETGPAQFSNGTSSSSATTGSTGTVTVTLVSTTGTTGTDTVTATINGSNALSTCAKAAGTPNTTSPKGNCSDSSTYTLKDKSATGKTPVINVLNHVINIGKGGSGIGVTGTPGDKVELFAYSRPSTTYISVRQGTFDANGQITFTVSPRTNTRLFAKDTTANLSSTSDTISVHPALALRGSATGKTATFSGTYVPGQGGAAIRIFTVKNGVLSASPVATATTDAAGHFTVTKTFAGAKGGVTFIVQSLANLTNASGQGNRVTLFFS